MSGCVTTSTAEIATNEMSIAISVSLTWLRKKCESMPRHTVIIANKYVKIPNEEWMVFMSIGLMNRLMMNENRAKRPPHDVPIIKMHVISPRIECGLVKCS